MKGRPVLICERCRVEVEQGLATFEMIHEGAACVVNLGRAPGSNPCSGCGATALITPRHAWAIGLLSDERLGELLE